MTDTEIRKILDQLPQERSFQPLIRGLYELAWKKFSIYTYIAILFACLGYVNGMIGFKTVCMLLPVTLVPLMLLGTLLQSFFPMVSTWVIQRYHVLRMCFLINKVMCGLFVLRCAKEQLVPSSSGYFTVILLIILGTVLLERTLDTIGPWNYIEEADNNEEEKS